MPACKPLSNVDMRYSSPIGKVSGGNFLRNVRPAGICLNQGHYFVISDVGVLRSRLGDYLPPFFTKHPHERTPLTGCSTFLPLPIPLTN